MGILIIHLPPLAKEGNKGWLSDRERQAQIETFGIQFIRFTNREVYESIEGVLLQIKWKIIKITSPAPPCKGGD